MSKDQKDDLLHFLAPFEKEKTGLVLWLRDFVWDLYPGSNELIYDNYNALAIGWSPTERQMHTFCSIAIGRTSKNIHFGFYWGSKIADPEKKLLGMGNQYRYLPVSSKEDFPEAYAKELMKAAYAYSLAKVKDAGEIRSGLTITKSVSATKRTLKEPGIKKAKRAPKTD